MHNRLVLMSALVLAAAACLPEGKDFTGPRTQYNLQLVADSTSIALTQDSTIALNASVRDATGSTVGNTTISYESADPSVAAVDDEGNVFAAGGGTTTVTATFEDVNRDTTLTLDIPVTVTAVPIASKSLTPSSLTLYPAHSGKMVVRFMNAAGTVLKKRLFTFGKVLVNASGDTVATVARSTSKADSTAPALVVTGAKLGTVQDTIIAETDTLFAAITVVQEPVASVTVTPNAQRLAVGGTVTLTATLLAEDGDALTGRTVTWTSSDESVATVSSSGLVMAKAAGTANITATAEGKSEYAVITVTSP